MSGGPVKPAIQQEIVPVTAPLQGQPPERLDTYSTLFTHALDLAIIVPLMFLTGMLILRREPLGYLIALPLLVFEAFLAPIIMAQTVSQLKAGVTFPPGQIARPIAASRRSPWWRHGWIVAILRNVSDSAPPRPKRAK
jgi:hypothetical protein